MRRYRVATATKYNPRPVPEARNCDRPSAGSAGVGISRAIGCSLDHRPHRMGLVKLAMDEEENDHILVVFKEPERR